MNYYIDTEFHEGFYKAFMKSNRHFIDLISIGIVSEDGRKYYAISKEFDIYAAWNKWQQRTGEGDRNSIEPKVYWLRDNVLKPIYSELFLQEVNSVIDSTGKVPNIKFDFTYDNFKKLIKKYGKTNKQIAEEIKEFIDLQKVSASYKGENPKFYGCYIRL